MDNHGKGLGYEELSGLFAISFDTYATAHEDAVSNLQISIQTRDPKLKLLSSKKTYRVASNTYPINFAVIFSLLNIFKFRTLTCLTFKPLLMLK